ncbi:MAG: glucosaminidase domain-containing protein [Bacilli bacterium]|nr:glucosaminidase domain-containing protein [Bacilli bacterium]
MKIDVPLTAKVIIGIIVVVLISVLINKEANATNHTKTLESVSYTNDILIKESIVSSITALVEDKVVEETNNQTEEPKEVVVEEVIVEPIVYDNMTLNELTDKLNRSLNSTLSNTGYLFASKSLELGLDPYLAVSIVLHETGCTWECSNLVNACNNVGGIKGSPGCNGGSYKAFNTLEEGINSYLENLYNNYYKVGLTTPEAINSKYAESTTWADKINYYINYIKQK